jgi:hypothetical protein
MVAPVIIGGAAIAGGIIAGIASGYAIDKVLGDGNYTAKEVAVDGAMGVIPGVGFLKPTGKILWNTRKLRYFDRAQGDRIRDVPWIMAVANADSVVTIGKTIATEKVVDHIASNLLEESRRPSSMSFQQNGGRRGKPKVSEMTKVSWDRKKGSRKWIPSCRPGYRLQRIGKKLMCVKN